MINILLCGVGGQGTLLASNLIAESAMESGFDVKKSEIHGMAQRGGSVVSHVRFGEKVSSPVIRKGECDILVSFEELEAMRWSEYLKKGGLLLCNRQNILPMSVSAGNAVYPENCEESLHKLQAEVLLVDGIKHAKALGNKKCLNIIMLGVLAKKLDKISKETWIKMMKTRIPQKLLELNLKAFEVGYSTS